MRSLAFLFWLALWGASTATAHSADEVWQAAYLTLGPGEVRLELEITPGYLVASQFLIDLDTDADQQISTAEARTFAQRVLELTELELGDKTAYWELDQVELPPYRTLQWGAAALRIHARAERADRAGEYRFHFANRYQPGDGRHMANIFLQPGERWDYRVLEQIRTDSGQGLQVDYEVIPR